MIRDDVVIGEGTKIWHPELVNLYGCTIGRNCNIGAFVEIGKGVIIGDRVAIGAHCFIPEGVEIEDDCFIGPRCTFCNDIYPPSYGKHWGQVIVRKGASLGAGVILVPGVEIGEGVMIGAGALVSRSIPAETKAYGHPARHMGRNPLLGKVNKDFDPTLTAPVLKWADRYEAMNGKPTDSELVKKFIDSTTLATFVEDLKPSPLIFANVQPPFEFPPFESDVIDTIPAPIPKEEKPKWWRFKWAYLLTAIKLWITWRR
ncbi:MAG: acyltransferase [Candidatus Colwellbacteria bacterium]|nr:acyltransferase [Candidatus Colwellbacteria bacterium]